ncbi:hypothetical protein [Paenibacillus humicola]|uniref:hypothetical protein n=1 Tax=Paenibacillus humicola TaxID=3110540 RepID=UPI00237BC9F1|nr:hypothetical protein [Paenibacillus humicola]
MKLFLIGAILLIAGAVWAITLNGIGILEWLLLLSGIVLGIFAGLLQGWVIRQKERGKIGSGKMTFGVTGIIIVLIVIKVILNLLIPSQLATSESGIYLSIVFAISGLMLGRSFYPRFSGERNRIEYKG